MKANNCDRCENKANVFCGYGPHWFCKKHFLYFFEKRFRRTVRTNKLIEKGEKIAVGLSGGKDSTTALFLLQKIFQHTNPIEAIIIDEGIPNYRDKAIAIAKQNCKKWGIPFHQVSFKKAFGFRMIEVMKKTGEKKLIGSTCAFCGVFRRRLLNETAKKIGADKIATGHNLDDECQSIVMNLFEADLSRMARLGPMVCFDKKNFVPRIKPLYDSPEAEIIAFADFNGLEHFSRETCCPFKWQAKRNFFRKMLNEAEQQFPGTKYKILQSFRQLKPRISDFAEKKKVSQCRQCGSILTGKSCVACGQLKKLRSPAKH